MTELLPGIIRITVLVVILVFLAAFAPRRANRSIRGWSFVLLGFGLLLFGSVLSYADRLVPLAPADLMTIKWLQEDVGFLGGVLFIAIGIKQILPTVDVRKQKQEHERKLATANLDLQGSQALVNSILKSSLSGVMVLRAVRDEGRNVVDLECLRMNPAAEQVLGRTASDLVGKHLLGQIPCIKTEGLFGDALSVLESNLPFSDERHCTTVGGGTWYRIAAVKHGDGITVTFADINDQKRNEEKLRYAAQHDTLTGLPNRSLFSERLEQALNRANRFKNYKFAVLFLDFDRFKIINDSLGHEVGDQLLISISKRLQSNLRAVDVAAGPGEGHLPARLGGDEFVVLLDSIKGIADAVSAAERLQKELSAPHLLDGHEVISTASIGIVTSDIGHDRPDDIIRDADTAMYRAKTTGKNRHVVFDEEMHQAVVSQLELERSLRDAVSQKAFVLNYQPIVALESGELVAIEALIRWPHREHRGVAPADFIALAEELGLIGEIGDWVLGEACRTLRGWQTAHPSDPPLAINVNLSRQQLLHPSLTKTVRRVLEETKVEPGSLRLEITEGMVMGALDALAPVLTELRGLGVQLVMDDFGTGHSSLSCLHQLPIDTVKVDRSFITSAQDKPEYRAIVHAIVTLAHTLGMRVVAEGIETEDQLELLKELDCNYGQGRLFSEPLSEDDLAELLTRDRCLGRAA